MKKFIHPGYTAWEIRPWTKEKFGIVLFELTGDKVSYKSLFCKENFRFYYRRPNKKQWFLFVRLPFLYIDKNNSGIKLGTQNKFIWIIT
ncbi:hypothetical protein H9185_001189 [Listeria monocytogenes]|nr:hypothetical protein [Listeria monocytogenes]